MTAEIERIIRVASKELGISHYSFTAKELKTFFRKRVKLVHPDHGGTSEGFQALKSSYALLVEYARDEDGNISAPFTTTDGRLLSELGLGLGSTTNGRDCETCDHLGYTTHFGTHYIICAMCDDYGLVHTKSVPCRHCKGTGKFTQARSRRVVDCRGCKGTGCFVKLTHPRICGVCFGSKTIHKTNLEEKYYETCWKCNGTGEIEIHNPVLRKGILT
jgi:DnaJ-class molecular chaperone